MANGSGKQNTYDAAFIGLRYFGAQLALFRGRARLLQAELAEQLGYSESTIASIEQGRRVPQQDFIERADDLLAAGGVLKTGAPFLEQARYPAFFRDFAVLEADCVSLYSYENQAFPGQLQTESYARALFRVRVPSLSDEDIDRHVASRMGRQGLLTRDPLPVLGFVIEESVLRRPLGGTEVLKEQLDRLVACSELRNVEIQVMPTRLKEHAGMAGPVVLLETSERRHLAYVEVQDQSTLLSGPEEVSVLEQRYGIMRAQALPPWESTSLIKRLAGEL
ncbi:MAG TPA: transcriptional regulator [Streptomyces sp.]|nr:transcriptional regulator [Streptomyces sp.]